MNERDPDDLPVPEEQPDGDEEDEDESSPDPEDPDYVDRDATGDMRVAADPTLPPLTATPRADPMQVWPNVAPVDGEVYGFQEPYGNPMIAMTMATWQRVFKDIQVLQGRLATLSAENVEFRQGRVPEGVPRILMPTAAFTRKVVN